MIGALILAMPVSPNAVAQPVFQPGSVTGTPGPTGTTIRFIVEKGAISFEAPAGWTVDLPFAALQGILVPVSIPSLAAPGTTDWPSGGAMVLPLNVGPPPPPRKHAQSACARRQPSRHKDWLILTVDCPDGARTSTAVTAVQQVSNLDVSIAISLMWTHDAGSSAGENGYISTAYNSWLDSVVIAAGPRPSGEGEKVLKTIASSPAGAPDDTLGREGEWYAKNGLYELAIAEYTRDMRFGTVGSDYFSRAKSYAKLHKYDLAIADYNKVIEIEPGNAYAYNNRGNIYSDQQRYDQAIADYAKAIQLKSGYELPFANRANAYEGKGLFDQAIADANQAIALKADDAVAYDTRGFAYAGKGRYDLAISDYTKAISIKPDDAWAYNNRAWAYHLQGADALGLPDVDRAIALAPEDAAAIETRAEIYERLSRRDESIADYRAALKLQPTMKSALDGLKRLRAGM